MDANSILERTQLGQLEIAQRKLKLPPLKRALLIMVDGHSNLAQILRKASGIAGSESLLAELVGTGLIQVKSRAQISAVSVDITAVINTATGTPKGQPAQTYAAVEPPAAAPVAATKNAAQPITTQQASLSQAVEAPQHKALGVKRRSLALARMYLMNIMERTLGPDAEIARSILSKATSHQELMHAFNACSSVILEMAGEERLQHIEGEFLGLLPQEAVRSQPYLTSSIQAA